MSDLGHPEQQLRYVLGQFTTAEIALFARLVGGHALTATERAALEKPAPARQLAAYARIVRETALLRGLLAATEMIAATAASPGPDQPTESR